MKEHKERYCSHLGCANTAALLVRLIPYAFDGKRQIGLRDGEAHDEDVCEIHASDVFDVLAGQR